MFLKNNKWEKKSFSLDDLNYLYQYVVLNYDEIKFFKNVFFMIVKRRDHFFDYISSIDDKYVKKTNFLYVTEDFQHNQTIFDKETSDLLAFDIHKELLDFLKIKIQNMTLLERIDFEYNELFKSKWIIFFIFVVVFYFIIYMLWDRFIQIAGEDSSVKIDMWSITFFYENNFIITAIFFFIVSALHIKKYIKHNPFYSLQFSQYYVLLIYKEKLYSMLLSYYIYKWENKKWEIWYINTKNEFYNIYEWIFQYISKDEIWELLFFLENDQVAINLKNPLLKQDIINDYKNFKYIQNNAVKNKLNFFNTQKDRLWTYNSLLELNYNKEFERIKWYMNLKGLILYLVVTFGVIFMILPVLLSAL